MRDGCSIKYNSEQIVCLPLPAAKRHWKGFAFQRVSSEEGHTRLAKSVTFPNVNCQSSRNPWPGQPPIYLHKARWERFDLANGMNSVNLEENAQTAPLQAPHMEIVCAIRFGIQFKNSFEVARGWISKREKNKICIIKCQSVVHLQFSMGDVFGVVVNGRLFDSPL